MLPDQLPDPWKSFFDEIDAALDQELTLHCLGGFVAKILYGLTRETSDVDVLPISSNDEIDSVMNTALEGSSLHKKYGVYLQIVGVAPVPDGYESRLIAVVADGFKTFVSSLSSPTI